MYLVETIRALREVCPDFNVMAGTAGLYQPLFNQGSYGCVAGTSNAFPEILVQLYEALRTADEAKASELQSLVIGLRKIQAVAGFRPASCYTLLRMRGVDAGCVRAPWREPGEQQARWMQQQLRELQVPGFCETAGVRID
jgi:dihydrodipicolinate synthase/N-acetylneuraminate lyase